MRVSDLMAQLKAFNPGDEIRVCLHAHPESTARAQLETNPIITRAEGDGAALLHVELWRPPTVVVHPVGLRSHRGGKDL